MKEWLEKLTSWPGRKKKENEINQLVSQLEDICIRACIELQEGYRIIKIAKDAN
ncbi:MAG: hypothetical protein ACJA2S_004290 [Cyclobacteriaceae bacterium]|jgi:hypothetical protein